MSTSQAYASTKIPVFKGKKAEWTTWSEKFLARAKTKGYKDAMTNKNDEIPKSTVTTPTDKQKEIIEANETGYGELISAMDTEKSSGKRLAFFAFACCRGSFSYFGSFGFFSFLFMRTTRQVNGND